MPRRVGRSSSGTARCPFSAATNDSRGVTGSAAGPSRTRGTLSLFRITQARAYLAGRDYAIPEDVKTEAVPSLAHRLALDTKAKYSGIHKEDIVRELLEQVAVGV